MPQRKQALVLWHLWMMWILNQRISIYDLYDFDKWSYNDFFTGAVNNWAWLCQYAFALQQFDVNIKFIA